MRTTMTSGTSGKVAVGRSATGRIRNAARRGVFLCVACTMVLVGVPVGWAQMDPSLSSDRAINNPSTNPFCAQLPNGDFSCPVFDMNGNFVESLLFSAMGMGGGNANDGNTAEFRQQVFDAFLEKKIEERGVEQFNAEKDAFIPVVGDELRDMMEEFPEFKKVFEESMRELFELEAHDAIIDAQLEEFDEPHRDLQDTQLDISWKERERGEIIADRRHHEAFEKKIEDLKRSAQRIKGIYVEAWGRVKKGNESEQESVLKEFREIDVDLARDIAKAKGELEAAEKARQQKLKELDRKLADLRANEKHQKAAIEASAAQWDELGEVGSKNSERRMELRELVEDALTNAYRMKENPGMTLAEIDAKEIASWRAEAQKHAPETLDGLDL